MNPAKPKPDPQEIAAFEKGGLRQMLTEDEVVALTRMSRSTLNRLEREEKFPAGVYTAPNTKRYFLDMIIGWQKAIAEHDHRNPNRGRGKRRLLVSASPKRIG